MITYEKVSPPHPAIAVNTLGEKSRAGLSGVPQLYPKVMCISPISKNPIAIGTRPEVL